ncbi:MAG: aminodeoxychorismate/anthranilate synthase component II [Shewanella sp.]|nr:aminodeoxychorismate/anthranilate synthase component II [Shewanella sp.]MCF1430706.1 aminodeoxychorismate/anthranilate synthase component II [Shewanella sp.]MCF1437813.1 aminodeoxychorismate/anthranilate synthase component II [Shewanella sp.]MCF1458227.1 aminodeoxychorismate/anthranilate synthase component II [Shewanella sp.]
MLLMIDNYDSFTFNLVQYFQQLGQEVLVRRNADISIADIRRVNPSHLVISPGPCSPDQAGVSLEAISTFSGKIPLLGVCLGHQAIGQVFGAQVIRAKRVMHGKTSAINHNSQGVFCGLANPLTVTRYHSLLLDRVPEGFSLDAWYDDPIHGREIMGIRHLHMPVYGVQFHPESILTEQGHDLLKNFLDTGGTQ